MLPLLLAIGAVVALLVTIEWFTDYEAWTYAKTLALAFGVALYAVHKIYKYINKLRNEWDVDVTADKRHEDGEFTAEYHVEATPEDVKADAD